MKRVVLVEEAVLDLEEARSFYEDFGRGNRWLLSRQIVLADTLTHLEHRSM